MACQTSISDAQRDAFARRGNAMRLHGVDAELLDRAQTADLVPYLDFADARFPIHGGLLQRRGGTARHDAVVGLRRAGDQRGVDIVQNCEVTGIQTQAGRAIAVERSAVLSALIKLPSVAVTVRLAAMPDYVCRSKAMFCRRSSPKELSRLSITS